MTDLRTLLAMRIAESDHYLRKPAMTWDRFSEPLKDQYLANADAAMTVMFDWLINQCPENATIHTHEGYFADLDDWISCQWPARNNYRGFEEDDK
jgi:hypothetical protein